MRLTLPPTGTAAADMAKSKARTAVIWDNPLPKNILVADQTLRQAIWKVVQYETNDGQNFMRTNAPWTDRTGNARQGLFARAYRDGHGYVSVFYHTVDYGIFLELARSGQNRIIIPTLQKKGPDFMSSISKVLGAMRVAGSGL